MLGFLLCGNISTAENLGLSGQDENGGCEWTGWIFSESWGEGMDVEKADHKNDQFCAIFFRISPRQMSILVCHCIAWQHLDQYRWNVILCKALRFRSEKYKNYLYIELMPEERKNAVFYEKHGFQIMQDGVAMQLCNFANKIWFVKHLSAMVGAFFMPILQKGGA